MGSVSCRSLGTSHDTSTGFQTHTPVRCSHAHGDNVIEQMEMSRRGPTQIVHGVHPRLLFAPEEIISKLQAVRESAYVEKAIQIFHAHCVKLVKKAEFGIGCLLSVSSVHARVIHLKPRVCVCAECLIGKQKKPILFKVTEPSSVPYSVCVECLIGKQKKPILFKVTEPSSIPYRAPPVRQKGVLCVCVTVYPECLIGKQKKPILLRGG